MPTNIFFNSKTQIASEDNFLYDFGVSRDPALPNNSLNTNQNQQAPGPGSLPRYKLKGDTTSTQVQNTQFAYQFSGHGDKSENLNPSDLFSSGSDFGFPTRTYSSQILTQIRDAGQPIVTVNDDIQNGHILPIFIFGSNTPTAPNPAIFSNGPVNAFTFRKVKIIVELFNLKNNVDYSTITQNLFNFRVFNMLIIPAQTAAPAGALANFLQTLGNLPTKTNAAGVANNYVANMPNQPTAVDQFTTQETAIGITPNSIGTNPTSNIKYVINYELDLDKTISLQAGQYVMLALKFNGSGAAGGTTPNLTAGQAGNFNGVNLKITSHVTIHDNTKSPSRDNL